jgi:ribosome-associated protein
MLPLHIRPGVVVPSEALSFRAVRASGPGGQNVNKVSSKVELRVNVRAIEGLDDGARARLATACAGMLDAEGLLLVTSQLTRDQRRNVENAREKVRAMIERALVRPKARRKTRPTRASVSRRLDEKRRHKDKKSGRRREE